MRKAGIAVATIVLLIALAVVYLQTRHGFAWVVHPFVASLIEDELTAKGGRLSFAGRLEVQGLGYRSLGGTTTLGADRVVLEFAPIRLLLSGFLESSQLEADGLELILRPAPDSVAAAEEVSAQEALKPWLASLARLPMSFDRARIQVRSLHLHRESRTLALGPGVLEVDELRAGGRVAIRLGSDLRVGARDDPDDYRGRLEADLVGSVGEGGGSLTWKASASVELRELEPSSEDSTVLRVQGESQGILEEGAGSSAELSLRASEGERSLGRIAGRVQLEPGWRRASAAGELPSDFSASLEIDSLDYRAANAVLAPFSSAQLEGARFDGALRASSQQGVVDFRTDLVGQEILLRLGPQSPAVAPSHFGLSQRGSWDQTSSQLVFERAELDVDRAGTQLFEARLGSRLVVDLSPRAGSDRWLGTTLDLSALLSGVDVHTLVAWIRVARPEVEIPVLAGSVTGKLGFRIDDAREYVVAEGELAAKGLSWRALVAAGGGVVAPLDAFLTGRGRLHELLRVEVESGSLELSEVDGTPMAAMSATGEIGLEAGSLSLELSTDLADPLHVASRLGIADPPADLRLEVERSKANWTVARPGSDAPLQIALAGEFGGLAWNPIGGERRIGPVDLAANIESRFSGGGWTIETGKLHFFQAGDEVVSAELQGELGLGKRPSRLELSAEAVDLLNLVGRLEIVDDGLAGAVQTGPSSGHWSFKQSDDLETWTMAAQIDVQGFTVAPRSAAWSLGPVPLSLRVDSRLTDGHRLVAEPVVVELAGGRGVRVNAAWQLDLETRELSAQLDVESSELLDSFEHLALASLAKHFGLEGGRGRAHLTADRSADEEPLEVVLDLGITALRLAPSDPPVARDLELRVRSKVIPGDSTIELSELVLALSEAGATRAQLSARGRIPLAESEGLESGPAPDASLALSAEIAALRLDPYLDPWLAGAEESEEADASAGPREAAAEAEAPGRWAQLPIQLELKLDDVDWRALHVDSARLEASRDPNTRRIDLRDARGLGGGLSVEFLDTQDTAGRQVRWRVSAKDLEVGDIARTLEPDEPRRISGRLDLESAGQGSGPARTPILPALGGGLEFSVREGRLQRSGLLSHLAGTFSFFDFSSLEFKDFHGKFRIDDGVARAEVFEVSGSGFRLQSEGTIGLDGQLNLLVSPRIDSTLMSRAQLPVASQSLQLASGLFALPMDVSMHGPISDPAFGVQPRVMSAEELQGTVRKGIGLGLQAIDSMRSGVSTGAQSAGDLVSRDGSTQSDAPASDDSPPSHFPHLPDLLRGDAQSDDEAPATR